MTNFFHAHAHTHKSSLDGMTPAKAMVARVVKMGQPAISSTDHGNMAVTVQMYKECKAAGIKYFPGFEGYLIDPHWDGDLSDKGSGSVQRYHFGLLALTERGYQALVAVNSLSHTRPRFSRFPRLLLSDLAKLGQTYGDDLAFTTGCFFGIVQQALINEGYDEAKKYVRMFSEWFPHTIVEVQHHNIDHATEGLPEYKTDDDIVNALMDIAEELDLHVIATQDSHYTTQDQMPAHKLMKQMVYGSVEDAFPGDSFHLATADWVKEHYHKTAWAQFEEGYKYLLDLHDVKITPLDNYVIDVPSLTKHPMGELKKAVLKAHRQHMSKIGASPRLAQKYADEMGEELSVIEDLGMPGYFIIWKWFVDWCRAQKICVEARGSANGSYVCFLLGITQVDSVARDCMFERFLSRDRTKPPDIDLDIEDGRRQEALDKLAELDSKQIGTWSKLGITINEDTGEERGSVFTTWLMGKRRQCMDSGIAREELLAERDDRKPVKYKGEAIGKEMFRKKFAWMQGIPDVRKYNLEEWEALMKINSMDSVHKSYGVHASGVLLSGNNVLIDDWIPTMLVASSDTTVTQYDMDDVEEFGLLKMDLLGQTSLSVMRICQELIGRPDPTDFTWIPENDKDALALLRTGMTDTGLFHFEGYALRDDMPVLMPGGWAEIASLRVGDTVKNPDGGNSKVTGVYPQGEKDLFEVTLTDGSSVVCTEDHLWTTTVNDEPEKVRTTGELRRLIETTTAVPKLRGFTPSNLGSTNHLVDPYVLGLLLGDGSFRNKNLLRFSSADDELVQAIKDAYPHIIHRVDGEFGHYFNNTKRIRTDLETLGLAGLGSEDKFLPDSYLWASLHDRLAVLQGLMDTDGTVTQGGHGRFTTISPSLAESVKQLVYSLGGKCKITSADCGDMEFFNGSISPTKTIYTVDSIRLQNNNPFRLKRKASRYKELQRRHGYAVASIVPAGRGKATCISVSSKSECFITKDWMVTHNTKSKGGKELKVSSVNDAILVQALYMPGCMDIAPGQSISMKDLYLQRKRNPELRKGIKYLHPAFEKALAPTYGCVVYQEQVISIMRDLGMSIASVNKFFKVVKDSGRGATERNAIRMAEVRDEFDSLCLTNGIDPDAAWSQTASFVAYGFNKNHATGYGIRSYRTAYLKAHHPLEYMTALLQSWAGRKKEKVYVREVRRMRIPLLPPDVNTSTDTWTIDKQRGAIRRGLVSIAGVGAGAAREIEANRPYESMRDFAHKVNGRIVTGVKQYREGNREPTGMLGKLIDAGVMDSLDEGAPRVVRRPRR